MNKIIINGRLTKDIELKTTASGTNVSNITVAVRRNYKNAEGNYDSDFINCTAFGASAELLSKYFKKGQEILISGHLQNRSWETETGEKRYATDVIIETIDFIGSKNNNTSSDGEEANVNAIELIANVSDTDKNDLPF